MREREKKKERRFFLYLQYTIPSNKLGEEKEIFSFIVRIINLTNI